MTRAVAVELVLQRFYRILSSELLRGFAVVHDISIDPVSLAAATLARLFPQLSKRGEQARPESVTW